MRYAREWIVLKYGSCLGTHANFSQARASASPTAFLVNETNAKRSGLMPRSSSSSMILRSLVVLPQPGPPSIRCMAYYSPGKQYSTSEEEYGLPLTHQVVHED